MSAQRLTAIDEGHGPPVVLIHSSGMSSRQWRKLVDHLSASHRVVAPDLLGSGANPPWTDDPAFQIDDELDALDALRKALDDLETIAREGDHVRVRDTLKKLVPEFKEP